MGVGLVHDPADFGIDHRSGVVGHVLLLRHRTAEEDLLLVSVIGKKTELVRHAPFGNHAACHIGCHADIRRRAGGHTLLAKDQFLSDPAATGDTKIGINLLACQRNAVALGKPHDHAERASTRDDGGLVDRI